MIHFFTLLYILTRFIITFTNVITAMSNTLLLLTLSDPTSNLVRQYDFPFPLRCRKTSDTVFVAFFRPLSESVRRFSSCSTEFVNR
jgi:hypothetical protein